MKNALYERNLFYQQLNFKYALFKYLWSLVRKINPDGRGRTAALTLLFLLLYLLDFILGAVVLLILTRNPELKCHVGTILAFYTKSSLEWCNDYLVWLMGVPWGIKLNTPLNHFLGTRYLYILDLWKLFYSEFIAVYLFVFVDFLLFVLPFGVTLSIMALHDFLKFLNLCLICFFIISNRIFVLQISALKSFGRLFMGKKWNVLRERVDSYDHAGNMNQLLIGTIIFTILLFLLPTTGMYTLAFFYLRVIQFSVQFALRLCAIFVNKLTVFLLFSLNSSQQDQPITKAEVLICGMPPDEYARKKISLPSKVVEGKWCNLECFSVDNSDITVMWNGREYSVDEIRDVVNGIPQDVLARDIEQHIEGRTVASNTDSAEAVVRNHSMMHWLGTLPKN